MEWVFALIGGMTFLAAEEFSALEFVLGGALGWTLWRVFRLEERLRQMERREPAAAPVAKPPSGPAPAMHRPEPLPAATPARVTPAAVASALRTPQPAAVSKPAVRTPYDWRQNAILRWLLSGNVPVKVGVLVSFFGVAFLLKYAVEQGWMLLPVELRLAGVAAFGGALLYIGWRLRRSHRVYALSVQGGGIGVLYLTVYASLRLFHVLPASVAFICLVLVAAFAAGLAVRQDARALAVLGAIGGFIAPLLASTGTGSHVALFSYYLVLNAGIAGVAWFRHWRMLNLLGFCFTFGIGLAWGAQYYKEQYFASVEPFLIVHFLLYTTVAVLSRLRQPFRLRGYVDSALVFGLPLVAFPLQAALVDGESRPLAWTATVLAVFYCGLALLLTRRFGESLKLLAQVYIALAVIFATLAVPLWLDAPWVSNTWALEAAAMIAIGIRQRRMLTHWAGIGLLGVALLTYCAGFPSLETSPLLLNERFIGGFMLCAAMSFCAWIYTVHPDAAPRDLPMQWITAVLGWFGWLLLAGIEMVEHTPQRFEAAAGVALFAALTVLLERAAWRFARHAQVLAAWLVPFLFIAWVFWLNDTPHLLAKHGWLAWPVAFAALGWIVHALPAQRSRLLSGASWFIALWLTAEVNHVVNELAAAHSGWNRSAVLLALTGFVFAADKSFRATYPAEFRRDVALGPVLIAMLAYLFFWNIADAGDFTPLAYIPILNVMLFTSVVVAAAIFHFGRSMFRFAHWPLAAGVFGLFLITQEIARSTHHLGDVRFAADALWRSGEFQSALSIAWSAIGIAAMVLGARFANRLTWMAGAALMAVVVVKLFGVDLGNTGSLTRVISFIGVGLLLLFVGYVAPVPASVERGEVKTG